MDALKEAVFSPASRLLDFGGDSYWLGYLVAMALAAAYFLWIRRGRASSLKGLVRYLLPLRLIRHQSTRLDLKMYLFSSVYLSLLAIASAGSTQGMTALLLHSLTWMLGPGPGASAQALPAWAFGVLPVVIYLGMELSFWLAHYAMHRIDWLWQFHKVHHSAEVLTPLTEWRQHPVDLLWVPMVLSVVMSLVLAPLEWTFGPELKFHAFWSPGLILVVYFTTILHLRHSNVDLRWPATLARVFQSPAHHQIHHSKDARHAGKNLGYSLAVWDWAFGTLYVPRGEKIRFGVLDAAGKPDALMTSADLKSHLWLPFTRIRSRLTQVNAAPALSSDHGDRLNGAAHEPLRTDPPGDRFLGAGEPGPG